MTNCDAPISLKTQLTMATAALSKRCEETGKERMSDLENTKQISVNYIFGERKI